MVAMTFNVTAIFISVIIILGGKDTFVNIPT